MKRIAFVAAFLMGCGCLDQLMQCEPIRALLFAVGAGAIMGWIETREQREFMDRMG